MRTAHVFSDDSPEYSIVSGNFWLRLQGTKGYPQVLFVFLSVF